MKQTLLILAAATSLAGCVHTDANIPARGVESLNVPVVSKSTYVFDAAAPDGSLGSTEQARLDGWFAGLQLGYGDSIYVDGPYSDAARRDVARVAGRYGMMVSDGAPVTEGQVAPGAVRVVVSRTRASVPNCPNWSDRSERTLDNTMYSNFGCAVNGAYAAMIANPEDLVHGREGSGVVDARTAAKAVDVYRKQVPTGSGKLQSVSTKEDK
ncbi:CpaD family pilus assembly protein [Sphingomonas jaspsi]|jgi:pilus assembly protein CpaD|uniref:CpaD family pilus assembly protein n=1 Tax=Sphingomonas jaspsi TaxID=392409 RepID=UPI0004BAED85|nr:CpaD family pilus assembly protein [Sphingomonas jaspsi]